MDLSNATSISSEEGHHIMHGFELYKFQMSRSHVGHHN